MTSSMNWQRLSFVLLHVWVLGVCVVVIGAFLVQFVGRELPCPLCILQR
ncbi:MAG: disulfide bond formation protein B, partial [Phycisphaeraceae bacterium]|nr:disulfide bond formation protein B [Phycisphaeraceae bacterium]